DPASGRPGHRSATYATSAGGDPRGGRPDHRPRHAGERALQGRLRRAQTRRPDDFLDRDGQGRHDPAAAADPDRQGDRLAFAFSLAFSLIEGLDATIRARMAT